jgi:hypothetical protein
MAEAKAAGQGVALADGWVLEDGGSVFVVSDKGEVELVQGVLVLPDAGPGGGPALLAGREVLSPRECHGTYDAALAAGIKDREARLEINLKFVEAHEKALKRLYRQRDERREWSGAWPGREVTP